MRQSSAKFCPVPFEQQPINEYQELKDSGFFSWATQENSKYSKKLFWVWVWGWVIAGPIAASSFTPEKHPVLFALSGGVGAATFVILTVARLYLGWSYIGDRLKKETVFYEESGWYDGQTWQKPPEVINRDRLIFSYQIDPILKRLRQTAIILFVLVGSACLSWLLALKME